MIMILNHKIHRDFDFLQVKIVNIIEFVTTYCKITNNVTETGKLAFCCPIWHMIRGRILERFTGDLILRRIFETHVLPNSKKL